MVVKEANRKRKALGIKVSEANYHPAFRNTPNVTLVEGSPYIVEIIDGETVLRDYFT